MSLLDDVSGGEEDALHNLALIRLLTEQKLESIGKAVGLSFNPVCGGASLRAALDPPAAGISDRDPFRVHGIGLRFAQHRFLRFSVRATAETDKQAKTQRRPAAAKRRMEKQ